MDACSRWACPYDPRPAEAHTPLLLAFLRHGTLTLGPRYPMPCARPCLSTSLSRNSAALRSALPHPQVPTCEMGCWMRRREVRARDTHDSA